MTILGDFLTSSIIMLVALLLDAARTRGLGLLLVSHDLDELLGMGIGGGALAGVLELYRRKFPVDDVGHAIRSLAYFGDADAAPLPRGLTPERWDEIKTAMRRRVKAL